MEAVTTIQSNSPGGIIMLVKDKISFERKRKGISSKQLAAMIGVSQGTISRYETGIIREIPDDILKAIVKALNCDFDEFVSDDPKYCVLASTRVISDALSEEDKSLLAWFHNLPEDVRTVVKQLWNIQIYTK